MEIYQLRYFAYAAKYENITMAAQELHVSQPSISKAIQALERELNTELLRKNGRSCVLTHDGYLLQEKISPVLEELERIPLEFRNSEKKKIIRINALTGDQLVPELIRKFREKNPDVFFKVMDRREVTNWDVCIRSTLPQFVFNNAVKLMEEPLYLAFHKSSRLKELKEITFSDIKNERFVMLRSGGSIRTISDAIFEKEGFIPDIAFECDTVHILKRMVQEGLGIAIWPKYSWRSHLLNETELTDVCFREIDKNEFRRSLYLIVQKNLKMTEKLEKFCKYTEEYFGLVRDM